MRSITANDGMTSILLGRKGENEATKIIFDISDWIAEYPQATFALINQKPNSTTEYPVVISQPMDGKVSWVVGGNELLTEGYGQCMLEAVEGNVVAKRHIWRTRILTAMGEPGEFPEPWESWLTEFTRLKGEAEDAQEDAEAAAEDSEAWAVGQRGGVDVDDEDPTYENNAKYYAIEAKTAQGKAEDAQEAAETAQGKAEDAQEAAETAQGKAEDAQEAAETAQTAAETAQGKAEDAQEAAETAQGKAEDAQDAAETAQGKAEDAQEAAETAQTAAETAQGKAEDAQEAAEEAAEEAINAIESLGLSVVNGEINITFEEVSA